MSTSVSRSTVWRGRRRPRCVTRVQYRLTARPGPMISHAGGFSMRRICFGLLLLSAGCIAGSAAMQRDDRVLRELTRQERWARQAIDARPARDQLESIRGSDYGSVGAARKEFAKLVQAVDRATWIRDT